MTNFLGVIFIPGYANPLTYGGVVIVSTGIIFFSTYHMTANRSRERTFLMLEEFGNEMLGPARF